MDKLTDKEIRRKLFVLSDHVYRLEQTLEDVANSFQLDSRLLGESTVCLKCGIIPYNGFSCSYTGECPNGLDQ